MLILKKSIVLAGFALLGLTALQAQQPVRQTREEYIERYKSIAINDMERYGIPASITLAQGILESDSGNSTLARSSNNHFGIKCKSNWSGPRVYHDDDAKGECFRSYASVEESYRDHAEFLDTSPRYDSLFTYAADDYKSWARGLKAAGYATAPDYAQRLIRIIEESELYLLDRPDGTRLYAARNQPGEAARELEAEMTRTPDAAAVPATADGAIDPDHYRVTVNAYQGYNVYLVNGVHHVVAKAGDTYESIGKLFRVSAKNLRKFNDQKDSKAQPEAGAPVFIERKPKRWNGEALTHRWRPGDTLYGVSQQYGVQLQTLEKLNKSRLGTTHPDQLELLLK